MSKHFNLTKIKLLTYHLLTALTLVSQGWGIRILIVEDQEDLSIQYSHRLKNFGAVVIATDGSDALKKMKQGLADDLAFDIIITDYRMPIMNGLELCEEIKNNRVEYCGWSTKIFVHSSEDVSILFFNAGITVGKENDIVGIFRKPSSISQIITILEALHPSIKF